jgi:hypothetical protein
MDSPRRRRYIIPTNKKGGVTVHVDSLIFAVITAFLIYKLNSVLGTRHGGERERPTPFARPPEAPAEAGGQFQSAGAAAHDHDIRCVRHAASLTG